MNRKWLFHCCLAVSRICCSILWLDNVVVSGVEVSSSSITVDECWRDPNQFLSTICINTICYCGIWSSLVVYWLVHWTTHQAVFGSFLVKTPYSCTSSLGISNEYWLNLVLTINHVIDSHPIPGKYSYSLSLNLTKTGVSSGGLDHLAWCRVNFTFAVLTCPCRIEIW